MKNRIKYIIILVVILNLLIITVSNAAIINNDVNSEILSKSDYDNLDEKSKDKYLYEYSLKIQNTVNEQLQENFNTIVKQLENNDEFKKANKVKKIYDNYEFVFKLEDVKLQLEQSMLNPVEFETTIDLSTINSSEGSIKSGGYVTKTQNKFIWYSGRSISSSVYLEAWTTPIVFDGSNGDTYDISELIYSWVGSSTNKDRVSSITCNVLQYDPRINNSEGRTYNTGWPEQYYSGSFSKTSSTLDLKAGCVIESMGCASTGIEINATFDDGNEIRSAILSEGWGTIQW